MGAPDIFRKTLEFVRQRKLAYQLTFASPAGQKVLIDLAKFCRADRSCFHEDARLHAVLEGRREVFLRIQNHLRLNSDQLYVLFGGQQFNNNEQENDNA